MPGREGERGVFVVGFVDRHIGNWSPHFLVFLATNFKELGPTGALEEGLTPLLCIYWFPVGLL